VGFKVVKVAVGQVLLQVLRFPLVTIIPPTIPGNMEATEAEDNILKIFRTNSNEVRGKYKIQNKR
jgi:hypothetical protein